MKNYLNVNQQERILSLLDEHIEKVEHQIITYTPEQLKGSGLEREARECKETRSAYLAFLKREAKLRQALRKYQQACAPIREGRRDGASFGGLSIADDFAAEILGE